MCGIFGIGIRRDAVFPHTGVIHAVNDLFRLSESRGSEAAGLAVITSGGIDVLKDAIPPSHFIRSSQYKKLIGQSISDFSCGAHQGSLVIFGHSRLVTDGSQSSRHNNQPVITDGIVGVHNGIIVNTEDIYARFKSLKREYEVDTEALLRLIDMFRKTGKSIQGAVGEAFGLIEGAASVAVGFSDADDLVLATNTGSLYTCSGGAGTAIILASERGILSRLVRWRYAKRFFSEADITQVKPGTGYCISLIDLTQRRFQIGRSQTHAAMATPPRVTAPRNVVDHIPESIQEGMQGRIARCDTSLVGSEVEKIDSKNQEAISGLRRCTKCILPETMPFIEFDDEGVCNYCREYKKVRVRGHDALLKAV